MTWLVIDGNNWFAQCDYASPKYGAANFIGRLNTLREQVEHSLTAVCWDSGVSFRTQLSSKYKAHRTLKPIDYQARLSRTRDAVAGQSDILSLSEPGFEADDLIATLVRCAHDEGERCVIFSADADLHQLLVAGRVSQVTQITRASPKRLTFKTMTAEGLEEKTKVTPQQWIDYRTMCGDKSDGIDGCSGLGAVSAAEILRCCGSLEHFYRSPLSPRITQRQRDALLAFREQIPLKRQLLTLIDDCPAAVQSIASYLLAGGLITDPADADPANCIHSEMSA